ncbi:hypothetical protein BHM03_00043054 [Ensete ventricosum]|nr:hypothetical protein BHM03_00043054 [Ensete ventricosum]
MIARVEPEVLKMFPMLVHLEDKRLKVRGRLMCALCPSKFEDDEEIRLHPRCSHIFYFDCFDTWVTSHISCPICRANLVEYAIDDNLDLLLESTPVIDVSSLDDAVGAHQEFARTSPKVLGRSLGTYREIVGGEP